LLQFVTANFTLIKINYGTI